MKIEDGCDKGVPELVVTASVCTPVRCLKCRLLTIGCEELVSVLS